MAANTIRILIATDSHVGYNERDPIRGDDSWQSFNEVMVLAKERDVDMVLLSGDLFHDNRPSRKAMYHTLKSLRENCYGEKPCELEILSDTSQEFQTAGGIVNYEDPDINVAIPVFSIHGNHDDPSGEGRFCALDILAVAGFVNYFGRAPENDNIKVTPVLLQKGYTKLALYGLSNVRDERLFHTFRNGKAKFLRPELQQKEWFNLMCLHQNHIGHTETGYLPENFLSDFLDVVIWGHEHECKITPRRNAEMGFDVIQPGSSVATSLCEGEAVPKHCGILSITGREYKLEQIRLKTVRPFVMREVILANEKALKNVWKKATNRTVVTQFLCDAVEDMIKEAVSDWIEAQGSEEVEEKDCPLPLIRIRVEYSAPEGGKFEIENPQRFSNRFIGKVANTTDVVQFYRKKAALRRLDASKLVAADIPADELLEAYGGQIENIKVESLVQEFLSSTTLEILPSNGLGDAVGQFVDKDDRHAVEAFVEDSLKTYLSTIGGYKEDLTEEAVNEIISKQKSYLEEMFEKGLVKPKRRSQKLKEKPDNWDSDIDGAWEDQPAAQIRDEDLPADDNDEEVSDTTAAPAATTRGRGRGRARAARGSATRKTATATAAKAPAKRGGRKKAVSESEESDSDVQMVEPDANDEDEVSDEPVAPRRTTARTRTAAASKSTAAASKPTPKKAAATKKAAPAAAASKQSKLNFGPSTQRATGVGRAGTQMDSQASNDLFHRRVIKIPSDDEDIEEDDFVPMPTQRANGRRR